MPPSVDVRMLLPFHLVPVQPLAEATPAVSAGALYLVRRSPGRVLAVRLLVRGQVRHVARQLARVRVVIDVKERLGRRDRLVVLPATRRRRSARGCC